MDTDTYEQATQALIDELSQVFCDAEEATALALRSGVPHDRIPVFANSLSFWSWVVREATAGLNRGGVGTLARGAADLYPHNRVFQHLATSLPVAEELADRALPSVPRSTYRSRRSPLGSDDGFVAREKTPLLSWFRKILGPERGPRSQAPGPPDPKAGAPEPYSGTERPSSRRSRPDVGLDDHLWDTGAAVSLDVLARRIPVTTRASTIIANGRVRHKQRPIPRCPDCDGVLQAGEVSVRFALAPDATAVQRVPGYHCACGSEWPDPYAMRSAHAAAFGLTDEPVQ